MLLNFSVYDLRRHCPVVREHELLLLVLRGAGVPRHELAKASLDRYLYHSTTTSAGRPTTRRCKKVFKGMTEARGSSRRATTPTRTQACLGERRRSASRASLCQRCSRSTSATSAAIRSDC